MLRVSSCMIESIILGTIQGIAEWLPVSSTGLIFLVKINLFNNGESISEITHLALWLHLGTFLAALIFFRKDVVNMVKALFQFKKTEAGEQRVLVFLIVATIITGLLGLFILFLIKEYGASLSMTANFINLSVGCLLLITAGLQFRAKNNGGRDAKELKNSDSIILGITQGLASLPGLSRSGLTISTMLLRKINSALALKLSFLMSLPVVLGGNIILNLNKFALNLTSLAGLITSFIFGILTIHIILKIAGKINFGWFVLGFGVLMIIAAFI